MANVNRREYAAEYVRRPEVAARRKANFQRWKAEHREHLRQREAVRKLEKRAQCLVGTVRTRCHRRNLEFDLDPYIAEIQKRIDRGLCEVTGVPFDLSPGRKFNSPSIDRIDPRKGYVYSNIRIVLNLVNAALGDWGEATLREVMTVWLAK